MARRMLDSMGFSILEANHEVRSEGETIAEIDILAEKDGVRYAVEVKAGRANLSSVRQAYANAQLAGMRPMLICKKAGEAVHESAAQLDVSVVEFSEYHLLLEPEELESIVKTCMEEVMEQYGFLPYNVSIDERDRQVLHAVATADDFSDAAAHLEMNDDRLGQELARLSHRGVLPQRSLSFADLKRCAGQILARQELLERLDRIETLLRQRG
ncbi:MAG: YraN family protein [Thermoplasmatota archaeon]